MLVNTFSVLKQLRHGNGSDLFSKVVKSYACLWTFEHRRGIATKKKAFHISDQGVADLVIENMGINEDTKSIPVLESFPGNGILTKKLLEKTPLTQLFMFENRSEFLPHLETLKNQYPSRCTLVESDFFQLARYKRISPNRDATAIDTLFNIPSKDWKEIAIKFVGILAPPKEATFIRFLLYNLPKFESIFSIGRFEFYFFISEKEFKYMISKPKERFSLYLPSTVMCQLFFDIELIAKVPNSAFAPALKRRRMIHNQYDTTVTCFIKMTPKADLGSLVPIKQLPELTYFIRQNMANRNMFVVPALEKWIPNSGPRIIKEGVPVFTKFGDLAPTEILNIFRHFSSWPEYNYSVFREYVANQELDYIEDSYDNVSTIGDEHDSESTIADENDSLDNSDEVEFHK